MQEYDLIKQLFSREPKVDAVYLFGSRAYNKHKKDSDIDLALATNDPNYFANNKLKLLTELVKIGYERVDLVEITTADLTLTYQALKPNKPLYVKPGFDRNELYSKMIRMYFHFEYILTICNQGLKERLQR